MFKRKQSYHFYYYTKPLLKAVTFSKEVGLLIESRFLKQAYKLEISHLINVAGAKAP